MQTGDVVWASLQSGDEPRLCLYVKDAGDKDIIQTPDGSHVKLDYREPADRDEQGSGQTWWKV